MTPADRNRAYAIEGRAGLMRMDADQLEFMHRPSLQLTHDTRKSLERVQEVIEAVLNDKKGKTLGKAA